MRIDYFIVSEELKDRIVACEMLGRGIELEGANNLLSNSCLCIQILEFGFKNMIKVRNIISPFLIQKKKE